MDAGRVRRSQCRRVLNQREQPTGIFGHHLQRRHELHIAARVCEHLDGRALVEHIARATAAELGKGDRHVVALRDVNQPEDLLSSRSEYCPHRVGFARTGLPIHEYCRSPRGSARPLHQRSDALVVHVD